MRAVDPAPCSRRSRFATFLRPIFCRSDAAIDDRPPPWHWTTTGCVGRDFGDALGQLSERDVDRDGNVAFVPLGVVADVDHDAGRSTAARVASSATDT